MQLAVSQVKLPGTEITYRWTGMDTGYSKSAATFISENSNYYPDERELIANELNQNLNLNGGRSNNIISGTSASLTANMSTTSEWLSPVLDSERISLCCTTNKISNYTRATFNVSSLDDRALPASTGISFTGNRINATAAGTTRADIQTLDIGKEITISGSSNNNSTFTITGVDVDGQGFNVTPAVTTESAGASVVITQHERYLDGIAPTGTSNAANYITKRFSIENPATALKILFEANRPDPATVNVYYKIVEEGDIRDFDSIPYVLATPDRTDNPDENPAFFAEREYTVSNLNSFSTAAVKLELKSTSTVEVPRIKNLRIIALAL